MVFKLNKSESARKGELVLDLGAAWDKLQDAVNQYQNELAALRGPVEEALVNYNEAVEAARGFAEDIASRAQSEFDDKSEKWQEGEKGEAAIQWKDAWENAELDELEIEWPDELSVDDPGHSSTLDELPEEAE